jgi:RHS repeat-associated protein
LLNESYDERYQFTGYEKDEETGLSYAGARNLWSELGIFTSVDRFAEKFPWQSGYVYAGNNPVNFVDANGDSIDFSYQYSNKGQLTGVTMNLTGKVINVSSNSKVNMADATNRISSQIESSFSGNIGRITFSTNVNLSVANSMDDVSDSDHVFALSDFKSPSGQTVQGASSSYGGKVAFIDADYFTGPLDKTIGNVGAGTAAHELGHLLGLEHSYNLMQREPAGFLWMNSRKLSSSQLNDIHNNYRGGHLNQGGNWEYQSIMSPSAGGYISKKMPYRGKSKQYIRY